MKSEEQERDPPVFGTFLYPWSRRLNMHLGQLSAAQVQAMPVRRKNIGHNDLKSRCRPCQPEQTDHISQKKDRWILAPNLGQRLPAGPETHMSSRTPDRQPTDLPYTIANAYSPSHQHVPPPPTEIDTPPRTKGILDTRSPVLNLDRDSFWTRGHIVCQNSRLQD